MFIHATFLMRRIQDLKTTIISFLTKSVKYIANTAVPIQCLDAPIIPIFFLDLPWRQVFRKYFWYLNLDIGHYENCSSEFGMWLQTLNGTQDVLNWTNLWRLKPPAKTFQEFEEKNLQQKHLKNLKKKNQKEIQTSSKNISRIWRKKSERNPNLQQKHFKNLKTKKIRKKSKAIQEEIKNIASGETTQPKKNLMPLQFVSYQKIYFQEAVRPEYPLNLWTICCQKQAVVQTLCQCHKYLRSPKTMCNTFWKKSNGEDGFHKVIRGAFFSQLGIWTKWGVPSPYVGPIAFWPICTPFLYGLVNFNF